MISKVRFQYKTEYRLSAELGGVYRSLHRCNGPAVLWATGEVFWHLNNRLHRYYGTVTNTGWWIHGNSQGS